MAFTFSELMFGFALVFTLSNVLTSLNFDDLTIESLSHVLSITKSQEERMQQSLREMAAVDLSAALNLTDDNYGGDEDDEAGDVASGGNDEETEDDEEPSEVEYLEQFTEDEAFDVPDMGADVENDDTVPEPEDLSAAFSSMQKKNRKDLVAAGDSPSDERHEARAIHHADKTAANYSEVGRAGDEAFTNENKTIAENTTSTNQQVSVNHNHSRPEYFNLSRPENISGNGTINETSVGSLAGFQNVSYPSHKHNRSETSPERVQNAGGNETRPLLVLHVGPRETGTAVIQSSIAPGKKLHSVLQSGDGWDRIMFPFSKMRDLISHCLDQGADGDCSSWDQLIQQYEAALQAEGSKRLNGVFHSSETFSKLPWNKKSRRKLKSLLEKYDVKIVVVYKPFHQWLLSLYQQFRKSHMFDHHKKQYRKLSSRHGDKKAPVKTFSTFLDDLRTSGAITDPLETYERFASLFGAQNVVVLRNDQSGTESDLGLVQQFVCRGLSNARHACNHVEEKYKSNPLSGHEKDGGTFKFDHDLLVMEAHQQKLIRKSVPMQAAVDAVDDQLAKLNIGILDLRPRISLSALQETWMWNRTRATASVLLGHDDDTIERSLRADFMAHKNDFSSVDAPTVMQDEAWLLAFADLTA